MNHEYIKLPEKALKFPEKALKFPEEIKAFRKIEACYSNVI